MNYEWLAVAMFVGFFFIMMSGYPVAFSFAGAAILQRKTGQTMSPMRDQPPRTHYPARLRSSAGIGHRTTCRQPSAFLIDPEA